MKPVDVFLASLGLVLSVAAAVMIVAGIWGDVRWAYTGGVFSVFAFWMLAACRT